MELLSTPLQIPGSKPGTSGGPRVALAAALLGFFMVTLDALIVNVALPSIDRDLGGGVTGLQWIVDGYTLAFAALLLSAGALSDRVGARRAFGVGLSLFVAASITCGLAPSLELLIVGRFAQGAGAAILMPASLSIVRHAYPDSVRRGRAVAWWAMGGAIATAVGPIAGGILTTVSWRLIFFVNVPVGVIALVLLAAVEPSPRRAVPIDWLGQVAGIAAMTAVTFGLIEAGAGGFGSPEVTAALAIGVAATVAFVGNEMRVRHPMVPLGLLRSPSVGIPSVVGLAFMVGYYGSVFLVSLYLQDVRGLSPLETGLAFLPMTALVTLANPPAARLVERIGLRTAVVAGHVVMATGAAALLIAAPDASTAALALLLIPVGLGGPLMIPPVTTHLLEHAPADRAGTAAGVLNTSRQIGGAVAIAIFGGLVASPSFFVEGLQASLLIAVAVLAVSGLASLRLPSSRLAARRPDDLPTPRERARSKYTEAA